MCASSGLDTARSHELFGFKVRLVGAEVASTGLQVELESKDHVSKLIQMCHKFAAEKLMSTECKLTQRKKGQQLVG